MATVSDITTTPTSGLNHIDALLDTGPDWNYLTPAGNTIYYTFSIQSGNESGETGQKAFTLAQQAATHTAFEYISKLTGIQFTEASTGTAAEIHLCNLDLQGSNVTGLCSWHSNYSYSGTQLVNYDVDAYVYLDNAEWYAQNQDLSLGGYGYETLLHELGHALGLKHPFDGSINLPPSQDNTNNTLMSYTHAGGAYDVYRQDDIAALKWLYGMDGLRGALGINSTNGARYIAGTRGADTLTGTAANDKLEGNGGNDMIDGGSGIDTAVFGGARSNYTFTPLANGDLVVASRDGIDGTDTLHSVEVLQFTDMSVSSAAVASAATGTGAIHTSTTTGTAASTTSTGDRVLDKLTLLVMTNAHGYTGKDYGNKPEFTGKADVGTTVKIFSATDDHLLGTATLNKYGMYKLDLSSFADGLSKIYATESDAAGNVLLTTDVVNFNVDTAPPVVPTYNPINLEAGSNQVHLSGTAEAGTTVTLGRGLQTIAHTTVGLDGTWQMDTAPLPNGDYKVSISSVDFGDNGTRAGTSPIWTINNATNLTGTAGDDMLKPGVGNNAVDGGDGVDMAVYTGSSAGFTLQKADWGFNITDNGGSNGFDSLINVERVQFDDGYVAIDEGAAQLARMYMAAFNRPSDDVGLGYWLARLDHKTDFKVVAREFLMGGDGKGQPEFIRMYGADPSDSDFVTQLYHNVLGREPDAEGYDFWINALNVTPENKVPMRAQMLVDFSDSPENVAKVVGTGVLDHGVHYVPYYGV
jgi:hypothetical protein